MCQCFLSTTKINVLKITNAQFKKLSKFGFKNLIDLLLYLPIRYEDKTQYSLIEHTKFGEKVLIKGIVIDRNIYLKEKNKIFICKIKDESGVLTIIFFHTKQSVIRSFTVGTEISIYGIIRYNFLKKRKEIINPEYTVFNGNKKNVTFSFIPIYSKISGIRQVEFRKIINQALKKLDEIDVPELLPDIFSKSMMDISSAIKLLHNPPSQISIKNLQSRLHPANFRLIFEELLSYRLVFLKARLKVKSKKAVALHVDPNLFFRFLSSLPFSLTRSQNHVISEIKKDLSGTVPMVRLLQGDVGSGKTLVAACSSLCAISTKKQVVIMVPTETLATQHEKTFQDWFTPIGIKVVGMFGKQNINEKNTKKEYIANGKAMIIIGTHSVFQEKLRFFSLGLIIIDEQHKFGVYQRFALFKKGLSKGYYPHQLIMTATPIPRTLKMMLHSILDISIIKDTPINRYPVKTIIVSYARRDEVIFRINQICVREHRQIYWICTSIKQRNKFDIGAVEFVYRELIEKMPDLRIDCLHSKISSDKKKNIIEKFRNGSIDILVSTTMVEVGIDVPNASFMIIEHANKFGLSQLHQLRGRIGRGNVLSYCICLYNSPISKKSEYRLRVFRKSNNGFFISKHDLKIRGPGEVFGKNQTGNFKFKIANLFRDRALFPKISRLANYVCKNNPNLMNKLISRWVFTRFPNDILF